MEAFIPWLVIIAGGILMIIQIRSKWPGWIAMPFLMLTIRVVHEIGISLLVTDYLGFVRYHPFITQTLPEERPAAAGLILLSYGAIAIGLSLVRLCSSKKHNMRNSVYTGYSSYIANNAWNASLIVFCAGCVFNGIVLGLLLQNNSLLELASKRAAFSDEEALANPIYLYAKTFASIMQIGTWGMILFARHVPRRIWLAVVANATFIVIQALLGGRIRTVLAVLGVAIVYHYGVQRLRFRQVLGMGLVIVCGLIYITIYRFSSVSLVERMRYSLTDIIAPRNLDEAAFFLRVVPTEIPFLRGATILGGLSHLLPGLSIPWTQNMWYLMEDYYFGGKKVRGGISAETYALGAENYLNFGYWGVIVFGILFGLFFGILFEWYRRRPNNLFLLILATNVCLSFFSGMEKRMAASIGGLAISSIVPVGILIALSLRHKRLAGGLLLCLHFAITLLLLYKVRELLPYLSSYLYLVKYVVVFLMVVIYVISLRLLAVSHPKLSISSLLHRISIRRN